MVKPHHQESIRLAREADVLVAAHPEFDEPLDGIAFAGGSVPPGDRVAFSVVVTHNAPRERFFLVQRHEQSIAGTPAPPALGHAAWPPPIPRPPAAAASRADAGGRARRP